MTTARQAYATSVAAAESAFANNPITAQFPGQAALNAQFQASVGAGTSPATAQKTYVAGMLAAAMNAQVQESIAKDVLKNSGDTGPA
jgi:hypothetical protein